MKIRVLIFIYTIRFAYLNVYTKFENTGKNRSGDIYDKICIGEKEKWANKGTDKQYVFYVTQFNSSLSSLYQISES